jgi:signal transduction histidine kinase
MKKEILIVEDEIIIVRELENMLQNLGHHVCAFAATAAEALQKAKDHRPDLVLMDIHLRGEGDGILTAEKIIGLYDIPFIYVTAFADQKLLDRAKVTEPYGYILKPVEQHALEAAIAMALYKHQVEHERAVLQARLHDAQKMAGIATLAGGLAHNFNNILWAVMGYMELTLLTLPGDSQERKNLQTSMQECQRANNIVSQFLTFSRQAEPDRQKIRLDEIIKETLAALQSLLPPNIAINLHIEKTSGFILANPKRLKEMLGHLYHNALDAMQKTGGMLEVTLADIYLDEGQKIPDQYLLPGPYWQLTIRDTGHGMDQEIIPLIFDPFFTTREVGAGLGLGLSVVYGIVRSHNGSIHISSKPGEETTFTLLLPKLDI